jgi:hypothetical protein
MNISSLRDSADTLLEQGKFEAAFDIYDVVHDQIWFAIGNIQQGLNQFSNSYLANFSASVEFRKSYTLQAANAVFIKTFELDSEETLNEFIFATYGRLQAICFSRTLANKIILHNVLSEFLVLYNLILYGSTSEWITTILRVTTPYVEDNRLKKVRPNLNEAAVKEWLLKEAKKIKHTDWFALNINLVDYLKNMEDVESEFRREVNHIVGPYSTRSKGGYQKGKKQNHHEHRENYQQYEKYERYEKYEKYEKYERQYNNQQEGFDCSKATEFEKAKYFGELFELKGQITKSQLRKKYLELVSKYHPDKVADLGQELIDIAEKKTKEINAAFEWFKKKYTI